MSKLDLKTIYIKNSQIVLEEFWIRDLVICMFYYLNKIFLAVELTINEGKSKTIMRKENNGIIMIQKKDG